MDTEVSSALSTLELDPRNKDARAAISRHTETGEVDRDKLASALSAARAFHAERGNVELLLELCDRELAVLTDKRARADLLAEKARLLFHEFARAELAVENLREALELVQGHPAAGELLRKIQDEEAEWEKTAQTRLKQAKDLGTKPAAAPHFAVAGELYLEVPAARHRGRDAPRPGGGDRSPPEAGRAAAGAPVPVGRPHRRPGPAVRAPGGQRPSTTRIAPPPRCWRARSRWSRARRPTRSSTSSGRWPPARASRGRCTGWWPSWPATRTGASWPRSTRTPCACQKRGPGELALLVPLATVTWRKLDNLDQAELYFRRIRKAEPNHPALMEFYRDYHSRRGEIPQLLALFAQAQKAETDPEKRIRLGIEMAELAEQRPQSAEKAIDVWKSLLRMRPGSARGGDRAPAPVHQDREVERAARDAEGRSRGAAQGRRRREDPRATWR